MVQAYSYDLRIRVIKAVKDSKDGVQHAVEAASQTFEVAVRTIYNWLNLEKATGDIRPKENWRRGHSHKIKDLPAFRKFVEKNQQRTLEEMAQAYGDISASTICRTLKKLNISYKKNNIRLSRAL